MKFNRLRLRFALYAMGLHFGASMLVACIVAFLVFTVWYPYPYPELAGGRGLFLLIVGVDLICGPLLTFVLYSPAKPRWELVTDLSIVVLLQFLALVYGVWTVWLARPLYLVHEFDRFKVITLTQVDPLELAALPRDLKFKFFSGPMIVGLRVASNDEQTNILFESVQGGRDYGERPDFYTKFDGIKAYKTARRFNEFIKNNADRQVEVNEFLRKTELDVRELRYLPIIARENWIAILASRGEIVGYLKGDGF